jgi:hypothetical protein
MSDAILESISGWITAFLLSVLCISYLSLFVVLMNDLWDLNKKTNKGL